jgi:hypothetical protein
MSSIKRRMLTGEAISHKIYLTRLYFGMRPMIFWWMQIKFSLKGRKLMFK